MPVGTVILLHNIKEYQSWLTEMFANEQFMNNHPNSTLRTLYRFTIKNIWPSLLVNMNQWALGTAVVIFAAIMVLFINDRLEHVDQCSDIQKNCSMVLMGYYFFPWDASEHYWLANMEDVVFGAMCGIFAITRDIFFASYICYLICRLSLLSYVVGHLEQFIDEKLDMIRNFDQKIDFLLGQCVKEHQDIIREFFILKKNSSKMFFVMLLVHAPAVANITLTIFKGDSTSAFALFVYCAAFYGCTHLYLILSLSEQLSTECANLATSIHFLKWYKLNIKQQKVLKFMLVRAQKPFVLTCGALFPANLSTFTKTMRAIYTILNAFINLSQ
ncbi:putative odorant receptor 59c [Coccinella septempunctata]|uniref:putative odorant receptor 59c n=1 Tax=Coccinella septempunctata TaxID=41139 RepID=UPI001D068095|nr:putative odorant receptor 59c [Coccinella septempunctata]